MANYDSNYAIAQQISARLGNSPIPFDSVYSICLQIYQELGGVEQDFDSVYSILLEILPLVDGGIASKVIDDTSIRLDKTWSSSKIASELANAGFQVEIVTELPSVGDPHTIYFILNSNPSTGNTYDEYMYIDGAWEKVGNTGVDLSDYATINYVDEQIASLAGTANSEFDGKTTEDFSFVQTLPVAGEEGQQVVIKGENVDTLYKYVSGAWVEQTPDANILYFDIENEALYSYISADHQFAPISTVDTIIVGKNLNTNVALKNVKTPGVYNVLQRTSSASKGEYTKKWTLTVEGIDYDEYELTDSVYQKLQSNYTIQKRTWSSTRATNDGWTSFAVYYAGEIKDSTTSKYYTWSSNKLNTELSGKQDVLTAGSNISISGNTISADGYVFDATKGSFAEQYFDDDNNVIATNTATGIGAHAEGYSNIASGDYGTHAEGNVTQANGAASHAEGNATQANGVASHAEGSGAVASGTASHAEGITVYKIPTKAIGTGSHAEGGATEATGVYSHTEGQFTQANNDVEHAQGTCNLSHKQSSTYGVSGNTIHSIGIGFLQNKTPLRRNAVEVMQNGDYYLIGVGGYEGTDTKVQNASILTLQEVVNGKADAYEVATVDDINLLFGITPPEPTQPNDEIWYTTNNNEAITIDPEYVEEYFDKPMLSNTYSEGKGIIKFDGDLTSVMNGFSFITNDYAHITSIQLPESVTSLAAYYDFANCGNLVSVKLPTNYTGSIGECAFNGCSRLQTIEIPEGVTYIGDTAFGGCSSLTTVTIPSNVTSLAYGAFLGCSSLESIICEPTTPPCAGGCVFEDTNDCPIYVPAEYVNAYKTDENWTDYEDRIQAIQ